MTGCKYELGRAKCALEVIRTVPVLSMITSVSYYFHNRKITWADRRGIRNPKKAMTVKSRFPVHTYSILQRCNAII